MIPRLGCSSFIIPTSSFTPIRRRLLAGESTPEIAAALNVGFCCINNQKQALRKRGVKLPDARANNGGGRGRRKSEFRMMNDEPLPLHPS
jgi:hypothetical protein